MPNTTLEEVIEEVKELPPEQQVALREFVEFMIIAFVVGKGMEIMEKTLTLMPDDVRRLRDFLNEATFSLAGSERRARMVRSVRGKYAHVRTSSEDFITLKREETRREDSKLEDRR
jgi:hypothetical protein